MRTQPRLPFTPVSPSSVHLEIRTAQVGDLSGLSTVLADSFYSRRGLMFFVYPLLRLGISEDLRTRLKSNVPHYSCLSAIARIDAPQEPQTGLKIPEMLPTTEVAGTVEIAMRSRHLTNLTGHAPSSEKLMHPDRIRGGRLDRNCEYPHEYLYISNLAVSPVYRRQGIARKLLLSCEPLALQWGYQEIYLHVLDNNERAKQLYLNLNYNIAGIESHQNYWFWPRPKCLLLRKSLVTN